MRVLCLLCVVLCGICTANAASHSLKYIYTVVSGDTDSPEFIIMGLVNDEQFVHYDSNIRRMIHKTDWIEKSVDKQYWDKQTQKALYAHQIFKDNFRIAMQHFMSTQGVHILEWIVGCQWNDETGDTGGIEHYEYDRKYFLTDDMKTWNFIPPAQQLFISAVKWNPAELENGKQYQTQICIESLKKYVSYRSTLERTVPPEVTDIKSETRSFNPDGSSPLMGVIIGCVVGALILALTLAVIGFVIWKKRSSVPDYEITRTRSFIPEGSSSSMCRTLSSSASPSLVLLIGKEEKKKSSVSGLAVVEEQGEPRTADGSCRESPRNKDQGACFGSNQENRANGIPFSTTTPTDCNGNQETFPTTQPMDT